MIPSPALQERIVNYKLQILLYFKKWALVSRKDFAATPRRKQVMG